MNEFARTLRALSAASGKTEGQLANIAGLDRAYVCRLMTGEKRHPSPMVVIRLAIAVVACPELIRRYPSIGLALDSLVESLLADAAVEAASVGVVSDTGPRIGVGRPNALTSQSKQGRFS